LTERQQNRPSTNTCLFYLFHFLAKGKGRDKRAKNVIKHNQKQSKKVLETELEKSTQFIVQEDLYVHIFTSKTAKSTFHRRLGCLSYPNLPKTETSYIMGRRK
jgi:hypothetical protein